MLKPAAAIVLAAGQGTRMKSKLPKVLHPLGGKALLAHAIDAVAGLEADSLCVVIRHEKEKLEAFLDSYKQVLIAEQDEIPGTGRAVQCAVEVLEQQGIASGVAVVTSGDVPLLETETLTKLVQEHAANNAAVTVLSTLVDDATGYGRIVRDENGDFQAIVEHRDASAAQREIKEINAGIYAFDLEFLREGLSELGQDNDQGEVYLTDMVAVARVKNLPCLAYILTDSWQAEGCNDREQLAVLAKEHNRRNLQALMRSGVSVVDPDNTWVEKSVHVEADVTLLPGTILQGHTFIASGSEIGPFTCLRNVKVREAMQVRYQDLYDQILGEENRTDTI